MKPWEVLETITADGITLKLARHNREFLFLGMGFTLRAALDLLPAAATVVVSELIPAAVKWNRGRTGADGRSAARRSARSGRRTRRPGGPSRESHELRRRLLDIDNGPGPLTSHRNGALYAERGIAAARAALKPAGILAVWSSFF